MPEPAADRPAEPLLGGDEAQVFGGSRRRAVAVWCMVALAACALVIWMAILVGGLQPPDAPPHVDVVGIAQHVRAPHVGRAL